MSCYEWEAGTIKIPTTEWTKAKATIRDAMNARQKALLEISEKAYEQLALKLPEIKKQVKAKKITGWDAQQKIQQIIDDQVTAFERKSYNKRVVDEPDRYNIYRNICITRDPKTGKEIPMKLRKPQKKDFPIAGNNVTSFQADDCSLTFDNDAKTIRWQVYENNHAREHAKATVLGTTFYNLMDKITWVRGTGGQIVGNDEYNRDSDHAGGGANYVVATFSAEEQKRQREAAARARSSYSYGGYGYRGYR